MTALSPLVSQHDVTWIASALSDEERSLAESGASEEVARDGSRYRLRLVAHDPAVYDLYYNVVANPTLWFVQHGLWDLKHEPGVGLEHAWAAGYEVANQTFAAAVCEELDREPDAAVFFHDYHLYLAPGLVREARPDAVLAHFVHIPWVGPEGWAALPEPIVRAIHAGLLASDVVGFHTERWRGAFLATCAALGLAPERSIVTAHPISVDVAEFESLADSPAVLRARARAPGRTARAADPPRRPHGSLEERRSRARGVRAAPRPPTRPRRPRRPARPARPFSAGDSGVRRRTQGDRGRGRAAGGTVSRLAPASNRRRLPAVGRRVQAVRRPARERRHGRAQPGREGGAAREHPRRRRCPIRKRRCDRGAPRVGASPSIRSTSPGSRRRSSRRSRCRPQSGASGPRRSASTFAPTIWTAGSRRSSRISIARLACARERPLARRRCRLGANGRCRREAALAPTSRRARHGADGSRDGPAPARAAEGRRARDRAARRDHGGEAHERADPALPSLAALGDRRRARGG